MTSKTVHSFSFDGTDVCAVAGTTVSATELINLRAGGTVYSFYHPVTKACFQARYVNKVPTNKYLLEGWMVMVAAQAPLLVDPMFTAYPVGTVLSMDSSSVTVTEVTEEDIDVPMDHMSEFEREVINAFESITVPDRATLLSMSALA